MSLTRRAIAVLLLLGGGTLGAAAQPVLERDDDGRLELGRLPPLLAEDEVRRQLTTGLTSTFAFRLDLRGATRGKDAGGALVEIRYELWDEVFLVHVLNGAGERHEHVLPSLGELDDWWRELRLVLLLPRPVAVGQQARIELDVIPFSRSEQLDTQRWLADSVSRGDRSAGAVQGEESLGRVFSVLLATSIQRRPVLSYRWSLTIPGEGPP